MPRAELDEYAEDVVLRDGSTLHIRPIRSDDLDRMLEMWQRLSPETIRMRFFAPRRMDAEQMRYFTDVDYQDRFALVGETGGRIVGVSRFDRLEEDPSSAEFAVLIEDAEHGRGIGTALLRALLRPAGDLGITGFVGDVLRENRGMLRMMADAGLEPKLSDYGSVVHTRFTATPTEHFLAAGDEQDRKAAVAALRSIFSPASIAVIGASRDPNTIGGLVFGNLLRGGFNGPVYPVNPVAAHVGSVAAYKSVADCPTVPELVLVCVPAPLVEAVVEEAAKLGSKAAVIVSAGFAELGAEGTARERALMETVRQYGMRVVGPNCMGVLNAAEGVRMNATFAGLFPPTGGRVSFSSQSGALGLAVLGAAKRLRLGLGSFASVGNKADISGNDLLQYWEADPGTDIIMLYLESFGNPRKFGRIARRIGRQKPIVAVKSGRTRAGVRATSSHTGAIAETDAAVEALFRQAGVIRTTTLEELFNVAAVLANQPVPAGNRVGILTNGGGPGTLATDACEANGLVVPQLSAETLRLLGDFLPPEAVLRNPVDIVASASAEQYGRTMRVLAADPNVDSMVVIFVPPVVTNPEHVARAMTEAQRDIRAQGHTELPIVSVFMSERGVPPQLAEAKIPSFRFPEAAAEGLGHVTRYGQWRRRPLGNVVETPGADVDAARAVVNEALDGALSVWLDANQTQRLLEAFGISTARAVVVHDPDEAAEAARRLGGVVAVKSAAPVHKTEIGGVRLGLSRPEQVAEAVEQISRSLKASRNLDIVKHGFLVQEMVREGVEMVVGVTTDPTFGPVLVVGMGGTLMELLQDVTARIHPLTDIDVDDMLQSLHGYPLLTGYRGSAPVDQLSLKELLFQLSALLEKVPEIAEVDLNPVFVRRRGVAAVDARVRLSREHLQRRRR